MNTEQYSALVHQACDLLGVPADMEAGETDFFLRCGDTDVAVRLAPDGSTMLYFELGEAPLHPAACYEALMKENFQMTFGAGVTFTLHPEDGSIVLMARLAGEGLEPHELAGAIQHYIDQVPSCRERILAH